MTDHLPNPGPKQPVPTWREYNQLREAIYDYLDHQPDDPQWTDIWHALGAILGEFQRAAFVEAFELTEPADKPCIRRLITGEEECQCHERRSWEDRELERISARDDPPHSPPHSDHATLWLDSDGEPALYGMHIYPGNIEAMRPSKSVDHSQQRRNGWFDVFELAREWGLEVGVLPKSWFHCAVARSPRPQGATQAE